jgi:hypothetical protein
MGRRSVSGKALEPFAKNPPEEPAPLPKPNFLDLAKECKGFLSDKDKLEDQNPPLSISQVCVMTDNN